MSGDAHGFDVEAFLEISSDLLGMLSAFAVAWPVYRIARARGLLHENKEAIRNATIPAPETMKLLALLDQADQAASGHDRTDERLVKGGLTLLGLSFVLRVAYHLIKHW